MIKRVFIADDDVAILDALELILETYGFEVACTDNGNNILPLTNLNIPDVFLLDIWMSGVSGADVCLTLKSNPQTQNIPIILVSAHQNIQEIANQAGADGFLIKPFETKDLLKLLESFNK